MDAEDVIFLRRSIRKYEPRAVPEEDITVLMRAAMAAPSAGNEQPWHFVVIRDRQILEAIPVFHPHAAMLKDASVAILICGDLTLEKYKGFWVQDCSAATQNLLLAATARGLGTVWTAIYPIEDRVVGIRKLLHLPNHVIPLSLVPIGYPFEHPGRADRFRADRVHHDQW